MGRTRDREACDRAEHWRHKEGQGNLAGGQSKEES